MSKTVAWCWSVGVVAALGASACGDSSDGERAAEQGTSASQPSPAATASAFPGETCEGCARFFLPITGENQRGDFERALAVPLDMTGATILWGHARYTPDVVVVALSTNDFSPGDAPAGQPRAKLDVGMYTDAYVQFVSKLRGLYPEAEIFALTSQLLSDGSPDASYRSATDLQTAVTNVAQRFNAQGDSKVHSFVTMRVSGLGCSGHPNVQQSEQLGQQLAAEIRSVLGL